MAIHNLSPKIIILCPLILQDDVDHDPDDDDDDPDDDDVVTQSWGEGRTIQPASAQWSHRQFTAAAIFTTGSLGSLKKKEYLQGEFPPKNIC